MMMTVPTLQIKLGCYMPESTFLSDVFLGAVEKLKYASLEHIVQILLCSIAEET